MSELVEKVETAIEYQIQNHGFGPHVSRAAIAAVAEWMIDEFSYQAEMIEIKEGIDAALRAAGDGR